jgi:hypothetical protein
MTVIDSSQSDSRAIFTGQDFAAWRKRHGLSRFKASEILGMGRNQPRLYEAGQRIPEYVRLACMAVDNGLHEPEECYTKGHE